MSANVDAPETSGVKPVMPPTDLTLNLDLYNYDSPDAQSCPYVLTSPKSLEACSRIGIKPVDLLHKSLAEFSEEVESDKPLDEIVKLYNDHEKQRIILLHKCQAEREFLIWRSTSKTKRSHSLSPSRHSRVRPSRSKLKGSRSSRRRSHDDLLAANRQEASDSHGCCVKNFGATSFSTPTSPYYQGSRNLFVKITSPVVCAKLQAVPKAKMRLPPKDMKILEVILQKYEKLEEEEERKALAQKKWDQERAELEQQKEAIEMERWKMLALKAKRSNSEEHLKSIGSEKDSSSSCSRYSVPEKNVKDNSTFQKRHSFRNTAKHSSPRNQLQSCPEQQRNPCQGKLVSERVSRYEAEQKLREIQTKQELAHRRRLEIIQKRDETLKRSATEFEGKLKQVKLNQQELDKALEVWRNQVVSYQQEANIRAAERVSRVCQEKRFRAMQSRLLKQEEHKRNMQKIEAEDYAKLQEMMAKLRSKDERCRAFKEEKTSTIEQSRQVAQAASDLRDLIRQRLDKDSFLRKSQQAALESRLLGIEPHPSQSSKPFTEE